MAGKKENAGEAGVPASLDLADIEGMVRRRVQIFSEPREVAVGDVAREFGFSEWAELLVYLKARKVAEGPGARGGEGIVFSICFSRGRVAKALGEAGLCAEPYLEAERKLILGMRKPVEAPAKKVEVDCAYLRSAYRVRARVEVVRFGLPTELRITVADGVYGARLREDLLALAVKDGPSVESERRHTALWGEIDELLGRFGMTLDQLRGGQVVLPREGLEELIRLAERTPANLRGNLHGLCGRVGKGDRERAVRWLISQFKDPDADSQLGVRILELAIPAIAGDLIELIRDRRYGAARGCLCLALARTRDKRAGDVIGGVLKEPGVTRWAIEALGKLKAKEHAAAVREFLGDGDSEVRREARKTLKKMGVVAEAQPEPVHLVKNRAKVARGLSEWSTNLDMEEVEAVLKKLGGCVEGFGASEIAEVLGVVEEMSAEQTRAFRFPVKFKGEATDVWIVIFMDDVDSPDVGVHGTAELMAEVERAVGIS